MTMIIKQPKLIKWTDTNRWECWGPDLTTAMSNCVRACISEKNPDVTANIESHFFNLTIGADTMEYSLDLGKHLWLNRSRWSRLTKEYISREHLGRFLDQCVEIYDGKARKGATANMLFKDPARYEKKHRWGGCLMGATFRGEQNCRATLTFYSRTTYIGYMAFLDAAIARVMTDYITSYFKDVRFIWHISSAQLHCFKTLPYVFSQPDLYDTLNKYQRLLSKDDNALKSKVTGTWYHMTKWYNKILIAHAEHGEDMLEFEKYGPYKRIKRRWMEHEGHSTKNLPPSVTCDELDFSKCID